MIQGHGDDLHNYDKPIGINFSSNVYTHLDNAPLKAYLKDHLDFIDFYPQPEAESLRRALAEHNRIQSREVCVTAGATEAIYLIAQAFAGSCSVVLMPTFSEYADACRLHRHTVKPLYALDSLPVEARLCWICNPNNPTGEVREKEALLRLIRMHADVLFIIDQSYEDFTCKTLFSDSETVLLPNVILLHSMTKRHKMAGIRLGYFTACEPLTATIVRHKTPWSVNNLAIVAGHFLLNHPHPIDLSAYLEEVQRLRKGLSRLPILEVYPSDTHILLIRLRMGKAAALKEYLVHQHGILIRDASNFEGLDDRFFRIAAQSPKENDQLIQAITEWMQL